jgi:DNA mismatch repair protein MutS
MRIKEWEGRIVFLHEVIAGAADRSYGIHVAQMAGLPPATIARAEQVLAGLEQEKAKQGNLAESLSAYDAKTPPPAKQKILNAELDSFLSALDPDALSPKQALEILYRIKTLARS